MRLLGGEIPESMARGYAKLYKVTTGEANVRSINHRAFVVSAIAVKDKRSVLRYVSLSWSGKCATTKALY